jgi:hypothetical protein
MMAPKAVDDGDQLEGAKTKAWGQLATDSVQLPVPQIFLLNPLPDKPKHRARLVQEPAPASDLKRHEKITISTSMSSPDGNGIFWMTVFMTTTPFLGRKAVNESPSMATQNALR